MNLLDSRTMRTVGFSSTGMAFFLHWIVVRPMTSTSETQTQWPFVLWFSATILTLTLAIPMYGRMIGGRWVIRLASAAGAPAPVSSAANIIEDDFGQNWAFLLFALGSAAMLLTASREPARFR